MKNIEEKKKEFKMLVLDSNVTSNTHLPFKFSIDDELLGEWWQWIQALLEEAQKEAVRSLLTHTKESFIEYRKAHNINQAELGRRMNVPQSTISRIEKGEVTISLNTLTKFINL